MLFTIYALVYMNSSHFPDQNPKIHPQCWPFLQIHFRFRPLNPALLACDQGQHILAQTIQDRLIFIVCLKCALLFGLDFFPASNSFQPFSTRNPTTKSIRLERPDFPSGTSSLYFHHEHWPLNSSSVQESLQIMNLPVSSGCVRLNFKAK